MEPQKIEQYVRCLLESWAVHDDGDEQGVYRTLYHLLMAVCRYELMSADERVLATALTKKMQYYFETKFSLKERKRKTTKEKFPLKPLLKEKEKKETRKSKRESVCDANSESGDDLKKRREAFHQQCLAYNGKYNTRRLAAFYRHFSQENEETGKMMFEEEKYWNLQNRIELWMENQHTTDIAAASERLKKARGKRQQEQADSAQQRAIAAERERANAEAERQREADKVGAVSREEWESMKKQREKKTTDCTD